MAFGTLVPPVCAPDATSTSDPTDRQSPNHQNTVTEPQSQEEQHKRMKEKTCSDSTEGSDSESDADDGQSVLRKGAWTPEEDQVLRKMVLEENVTSWPQIATCIPGRTSKQCRERWKCNLNPAINKEPWTEEEDSILIQLQEKLGNRWAVIAKSLKNRTENAIKTRFRSILRKRRREWSSSEDSTILFMRLKQRCRWETIADALPKRTKNGVKNRFKALMENSDLASAGSLLLQKDQNHQTCAASSPKSTTTVTSLLGSSSSVPTSPLPVGESTLPLLHRSPSSSSWSSLNASSSPVNTTTSSLPMDALLKVLLSRPNSFQNLLNANHTNNRNLADSVGMLDLSVLGKVVDAAQTIRALKERETLLELLKLQSITNALESSFKTSVNDTRQDFLRMLASRLVEEEAAAANPLKRKISSSPVHATDLFSEIQQLAKRLKQSTHHQHDSSAHMFSAANSLMDFSASLPL